MPGATNRLRAVEKDAAVSDVEDRGPGELAGVARGVHALDRFARLFPGDEHRRRRPHALKTHREDANQAEERDAEDQHRDHHLDQREPVSALWAAAAC